MAVSPRVAERQGAANRVGMRMLPSSRARQGTAGNGLGVLNSFSVMPQPSIPQSIAAPTPARRPVGGGFSMGTRQMSAAPRISSNRTGNVGMVQPAAVAPPPAPSVPMDENSYLQGDSAYLSQQAALADALRNYQAQMNDQQHRYEVDYQSKVAELGYGLDKGPDGLYEGAINDQKNDFAGRGMLNSGLFGKAFDQLGEQFAMRRGDLDRGRQSFVTDLQTGFANFGQEQNLTAERARADALARRAAMFNIGA